MHSHIMFLTEVNLMMVLMMMMVLTVVRMNMVLIVAVLMMELVVRTPLPIEGGIKDLDILE